MSVTVTEDEALIALRERDAQAWHEYAEACFNPLATAEDRASLFQAALVTLSRVAVHES